MGEAVKIGKRVVDGLRPGPAKSYVWDAHLPGFGVRIMPSGEMSYIFKYRAGGGRGGRRREATIGKVGSITPDAARGIAARWARAVAEGRDPSGEREEARAAPLMADLWERYLAEHARAHKKPRSVAEDERLWRLYLAPAFGKRKVAELARPAVASFVSRMGGTPVAANRALALLSKMMNLAELWGLRPDGTNPCQRVPRFKEEARERLLSPAELAMLGRALAAAERGELRGEDGRGIAVSREAVAGLRLLVLTGARVGEVLGLRWAWFRPEAARFELPDSKTGARHIQLPPAALEVLAGLPRRGPFVLPGRDPSAPLVNIAKPWDAIRKAAGMPALRIHDLRHAFASTGAAAGMGLPVIGGLLGHTSPGTTARYAHLASDPLRAAAESIGGRIAGALAAGEAGGAGAEVIALHPVPRKRGRRD